MVSSRFSRTDGRLREASDRQRNNGHSSVTRNTHDPHSRRSRSVSNSAISRIASSGGLALADPLGAQQSIGNRAVTTLLARVPSDTAAIEPFDLDGNYIASYTDASRTALLCSMVLSQELKELREGGEPVPREGDQLVQRGDTLVKLWMGGEGEAFDRGNATELRKYYAQCVGAINACRSTQARVAADRADRARKEAERVAQSLDANLPALRELQRTAFRNGNENALLQIGDTIFLWTDNALAFRSSAEEIATVAAQLRSSAIPRSAKLVSIAENGKRLLDAAEKLNKCWASLQLLQTSIELLSGSKTQLAGAAKGVKGMATVASAGGTLLNASMGFSLYNNIYIGPMVDACLAQIEKITDLLSKGPNRTYISLGQFDLVNWDIEPGGRAVFDYMLMVMQAGEPSAVGMPSPAVAKYLIENRSDLNAGLRNQDDLPTESSWIFWREIDGRKVGPWLFANRTDVWAMLYGDCDVPKVP
jgi:hypothetical protein